MLDPQNLHMATTKILARLRSRQMLQEFICPIFYTNIIYRINYQTMSDQSSYDSEYCPQRYTLSPSYTEL